MSSIKVKALKRHGYGGKIRAQGTEYFIDNEKHVQILCAVKTIKIVLEKLTDVRLTQPGKGKTKTLKKEEPKTVNNGKSKVLKDEESEGKDRKGIYNRKDMVAKKS